MKEILRRCPDAQKQWEVVLGPLGSSGDELATQEQPRISVRWSERGFEVGQGDAFGEAFVWFEMPSCESVGYSWEAPSDYGGTHIPDAVHPTLWRGGVRVSWAHLETKERVAALRLMKARLGSSTSSFMSGVLWRQQHRSPTTEPAQEQDPTKLVGIPVVFGGGSASSEGRTFIPCLADARAGAGVEETHRDGWLFFGSRLSPPQKVGGLSIRRSLLGPTWSPSRLGGGRAYLPQPWLQISDSKRNQTAFLPDHRGWTFAGRMIWAAGGAVAADLAPFGSERAVILGGIHGCDARLLDLNRARVYSLPGGCPSSESGADDSVFVSGDAAGRFVWLKPRLNPSDSYGLLIDFTKVLQSQGTGGIEFIPAANALVWGAAHQNLNVLLTGLLFAQSKQAQDDALAALGALPGWQTPTERQIGVRAAATKFRVVVEKRGGGLEFEDLGVNDRPEVLLGFAQKEALILVGQYPPVTNLIELPRESVAVVAVPRSAIFGATFLPRLVELRKAVMSRELSFERTEGGLSVSYPQALVERLLRRPLTLREKQRACEVEKEILNGHERWELDEVIDRYWEWWGPAPSDDSPPPAHRRPVATVREEWKAMCRGQP